MIPIAILRFLNLLHSSLAAGLAKDRPKINGIMTNIPQGITQSNRILIETPIIIDLSKISDFHFNIPNMAATRTTDAKMPPNTVCPDTL